jgi:glycosyltransferase involved in cell wall biosynthesis
MKTKVFLIGPVPPPTGGVSNHIARLTRRIKASEDIDAFVFDAGRFRFFDRNLNVSNAFRAIAFFLMCDIIHIHISNKWKVFIARFARAFGKKVVYTRHNIRSINSTGDKKLHALSDCAIHVSKVMSDLIDEKTYIIPAYIPADTVRALNEKLIQQIKSFDTIIAAISSHPPNRPAVVNGKDIYGFDILLNAYRDLAIDNKVLLLLDPSGTMEANYSSDVEALNQMGKSVIYLTEKIDFVGLAKFLSVYVRPTRTDGDSIAVREALEVGVKVVASDCVDRPEGVRLFKSDDTNSLTNALQTAIEAPKVDPVVQADFSRQILDLYRSFKNRA